jgi:hypothetical protein
LRVVVVVVVVVVTVVMMVMDWVRTYTCITHTKQLPHPPLPKQVQEDKEEKGIDDDDDDDRRPAREQEDEEPPPPFALSSAVVETSAGGAAEGLATIHRSLEAEGLGEVSFGDGKKGGMRWGGKRGQDWFGR